MTPDTDIAKYLSGELTPAERAQFERRMGVDPELAAEIEHLRELWSEVPAEQYDSASLWRRIAADTVDAPAAPAPRPRLVPAPRRRAARTLFLPIAASLLLAAGFGAVWVIDDAANAPATRPAIREISTRRAQLADVYLADGTHVKLGPASTIRFASVFDSTRDVHLEGQAWFEVTHDASRPFTVRTSRGVARDLGTKFTVRDYADDAAADLRVAVEEGIVALFAHAGADTVILRADDLGRIDSTGALAVEHAADVARRSRWTEHRLEFRNEPLGHVVPELERWYDVRLRVADPALRSMPVTVTLTSERFSDALQVIERALALRVRRDGDTYTIHHRTRK